MQIVAKQILNGMSVDVEDYFHVSAFERTVARDTWDSRESRVVANTDRLLDLFADAGVRSTFFILGWVAERYPGLVRRIAAGGHEIASHGYAHRLVYDQTPEEFREDLRRSRDVIESAAGVRVLGYRAPSYSITARSRWALDVLVEEGYGYDASIFPIRHDRYGIPDAPRHIHAVQTRKGMIWEVPGSTVRLGQANLPVGGGGYFRILPYGWTEWGMRRINATERRPAIFYLHPWEIDPDQPRLPGSALSRFRHYRNLATTEQRLRRLCRTFAFAPIADILQASRAATVARERALAPAI